MKALRWPVVVAFALAGTPAGCRSLGPMAPTAPPPEPAPIDCQAPHPFGPKLVGPEAYAARHGATVTRFADLGTSRTRPAEDCGVGAVSPLWPRLACNDGSRPLADGRAVLSARRGSAGAGGRCGAILDLYGVRCPEGTYVIYYDGRFCPEGTSPKMWPGGRPKL